MEDAYWQRKAQTLQLAVTEQKRIIDDLDAAYMDHAAKVFDTLQAQTIAGPHG